MITECMNHKRQGFLIRANLIFIANFLDTFLDPKFWETLPLNPKNEKTFWK